ncbi:hypothetical protein R5O87_21990 [Arthrobacter globiformis]|uniref:hypothetical protein n=1 Tax=Arthrobacter globiformis TaxID=1665 RepID=UPI00397AC64A
MDKLASTDKNTASSTPERGSVASVLAAAVASVLVVFVTGYLSMQLQAAYAGGFLGFNFRPVGVAGGWLPYVWRLGFVLLAVAAVLVHRLLIRTTAARLSALTILVVLAVMGSPVGSGLPVDEEQHPLMLFMLTEGAKSPFTLVLIGAIVANMILEARRARH